MQTPKNSSGNAHTSLDIPKSPTDSWVDLPWLAYHKFDCWVTFGNLTFEVSCEISLTKMCMMLNYVFPHIIVWGSCFKIFIRPPPRPSPAASTSHTHPHPHNSLTHTKHSHKNHSPTNHSPTNHSHTNHLHTNHSHTWLEVDRQSDLLGTESLKATNRSRINCSVLTETEVLVRFLA